MSTLIPPALPHLRSVIVQTVPVCHFQGVLMAVGLCLARWRF